MKNASCHRASEATYRIDASINSAEGMGDGGLYTASVVGSLSQRGSIQCLASWFNFFASQCRSRPKNGHSVCLVAQVRRLVLWHQPMLTVASEVDLADGDEDAETVIMLRRPSASGHAVALVRSMIV